MTIDKTTRTLTVSQNTGIAFSVGFLLMLAGALVSATIWVNSTQNRLDTLAENDRNQRVEIDQLKTDSTALQLGITEIKTQLRSIDTTLLEIKENSRR